MSPQMKAPWFPKSACLPEKSVHLSSSWVPQWKMRVNPRVRKSFRLRYLAIFSSPSILLSSSASHGQLHLLPCSTPLSDATLCFQALPLPLNLSHSRFVGKPFLTQWLQFSSLTRKSTRKGGLLLRASGLKTAIFDIITLHFDNLSWKL